MQSSPLAYPSRPRPGPGDPAGIARSRTTATVFGVDVRCDSPLALLQGARAHPTGRPVELEETTLARLSMDWPGGRTICVQRPRSRPAHFRIEAHARAGYLMWGRGRGSYVLSADARRLRCAPASGPAEAWQRFLIGQVLPFAALVHGLEVLHASAVVLDGRAMALTGPSGAGKTSLALALCRRGAEFLTDDVLAVEPLAHGLVAHPGPPLLALRREDSDRISDAAVAPLAGVVATGARERIARVSGAASPVTLAALFFLDRSAGQARGTSFEPCADARTLLASTFNFVLDSPARMRRLLDVGALLARGRAERITVPGSVDADQLAAAVIARVRRAA